MVTAIIGILAGLTVPNFLRAAKLAKKTLCQNNLRLLNNIKELYLFDHPEVDEDAVISVEQLAGPGKYIKEDATSIYCPETKTQYPDFTLSVGPYCPNGPPPGNGSYPEHTLP